MIFRFINFSVKDVIGLWRNVSGQFKTIQIFLGNLERNMKHGVTCCTILRFSIEYFGWILPIVGNIFLLAFQCILIYENRTSELGVKTIWSTSARWWIVPCAAHLDARAYVWINQLEFRDFSLFWAIGSSPRAYIASKTPCKHTCTTYSSKNKSFVYFRF